MTMHRSSETDRWQRADELFQQALERDPDRRREFLAEACGEDADMLEEVLGLLDAASSPGGLLDVAPDQLWDAIADLPPEEALPPGAAVGGRYRVVRELGRGGMSLVYLAERADGAFEQRVAVKVLREDDGSDELADRLLAERQILASLSHPNVARVFDGGATEDGRPFFVIEYVEGTPIDRFADARRLSVPGRLRLFLQVARAVEYAHRNMLVHRDLKPSNILVTESGDAKLLDFGIAKILDEGLTHAPSPETRPGRRWMTPEYAAPEQVLGEAVTTATDIYALGVLLYELLTGHSPYDVDRGSPFAVERAVCETDPASLSKAVLQTAAGPGGRDRDPVTPAQVSAARGTAPQRLKRALEGDLEAIVDMALRKEPEARYPTVQAMAVDVESYLDGRPVAARSGARWYATRKWIRRHWVGVAAAAGFVLFLIGMSVALGVQRDRARMAADAADREAENARQVTAFLASVFQDVDPALNVGDTISTRTLLERGARRVQADLVGRPGVQAELYSVIGTALSNLGFLESGQEVLVAGLAAAREASQPGDSLLEATLEALANNYNSSRQFEAALPLAEEKLALKRARLGPDALEVALAVATVANLLRDAIGPDTAEVVLRAELARRGGGAEDEAGARLAATLAYILRAKGELDEAESLYDRALPALREVDDPDALASPLNNLAFLLRQRGEYARAAELYREALEVRESVYGRGHPTSLLIASNWAQVLDLADRPREAAVVFEESVEAARQQWPDGHWRIGMAYVGLGMVRLRAGLPSEAVDAWREAVISLEPTLGVDAPMTTRARAWLGASSSIELGDAGGGLTLRQALADARAYWSSQSRAPAPIPMDEELAAYLEQHGRTADARLVRETYGL